MHADNSRPSSLTLKSRDSISLRPVLVAFGAMFVIVPVGAVVERTEPGAFPTAIAVAVTVVIFGMIRGALWLMLGGRSTLFVDSERVVLKTPFRSPVSVPRDEVLSINFYPGHRFPEWTRWADLAEVMISIKGPRGGLKRKFLLMPSDAERASSSINAVLATLSNDESRGARGVT